MKQVAEMYTLQNGVSIPGIGFGTWQSPNMEEPDLEAMTQAVEWAVKAGYRHIDTAMDYGNESSVGEGIRKSGIAREDIFVTSKLWNDDRGYGKAKLAFERTLEELQMDYLDLYLVHWPAAPHQYKCWEELNAETWAALEELYEAGKIRAIGVSNFRQHHMDALLKTAKICPMVNQIEFHPGFAQTELADYCKAKNILVEAWSPLGTGSVLKSELVKGIAEKHGKSPAQVCIRWVLQHGLLPLPKSLTHSRIIENRDVYDFSLTDDDMRALDDMEFCGGMAFDPDEVDF